MTSSAPAPQRANAYGFGFALRAVAALVAFLALCFGGREAAKLRARWSHVWSSVIESSTDARGDNVLAHGSTWHRLERSGSRECVAILRVQSQYHRIVKQAGEHVAIHEDGRVSKHLSRFNSRKALDRPPELLNQCIRRAPPLRHGGSLWFPRHRTSPHGLLDRFTARGWRPRCSATSDRRRSARRADVLVEPGDGPLPRRVGRRLVVALRRRVVVEAVYGVWIDVALVRHVRGLP